MALRIVAFSDWRVQAFEPLLTWMESINPDYALYAGDDTVRMADFSKKTLKEIMNTDGFNGANIGFNIHEDLMIEFNTMKSFKKTMKKDLESLLTKSGELGFWRRHPPENYGKNKPIWIGPTAGRWGNCLYYHRLISSWIDQIADSTKNGLGAIVGNDCEEIDRLRLRRNRVTDLHAQPTIINNVAFLGLEGSSGDIGFILYSEEEALAHLKNQWEVVTAHEPELAVLVTHAPPKGILDLSRRFGINNIGSQAVRDFIERYEVDLVICGHSHINGGRFVEVDGCTILNIASHDYHGAPGLVSVIELEKGKEPEIKIQRLFDSNRVLRSIHKVGRKRALALHEMGIQSLSDICEKNLPKMVELNGVSEGMVYRWIAEARALLEGNAYRIYDEMWLLLIPNEVLIYDIETDSLQANVWCIGVWNGQEEEFVQFFQKKDEERLLNDFFRYVNENPDLIPVSFSATSFDQKVISGIARKHKLKLPRSFEKEIDLGGLVVHRTVGTPKGGLKELGPFFGYEWTDPTISGAIAGMEYSNYLANDVELDWEKYLEYNKDDVLATLHSLKALLNLDYLE